ncbi:hypothetical protein OROMI_004866 [Orobanche minor]
MTQSEESRRLLPPVVIIEKKSHLLVVDKFKHRTGIGMANRLRAVRLWWEATLLAFSSILMEPTKKPTVSDAFPFILRMSHPKQHRLKFVVIHFCVCRGIVCFSFGRFRCWT